MLNFNSPVGHPFARASSIQGSRCPAEPLAATGARVRHVGLALVLLIPLLAIVHALASVVAAETAVWEVYDHTDTYKGFVVAERASDGKWSWTYREFHPQPPPQYREAGKGTAAGGPTHYVWTRSDGAENGTITVSSENPNLAQWHNVTTGASGTLRRPAP